MTDQTPRTDACPKCGKPLLAPHRHGVMYLPRPTGSPPPPPPPPMTDQTPRTDAGRHATLHEGEWCPVCIERGIVHRRAETPYAIRSYAEGRADALREAAERVRAIPDAEWHGVLAVRDRVLLAILAGETE